MCIVHIMCNMRCIIIHLDYYTTWIIMITVQHTLYIDTQTHTHTHTHTHTEVSET